MKNRIELFDYLRGAACILVVLFHYTVRYQELFGMRAGWNFTVSFGSMAVSVFFLLSGYLCVIQQKEDVSIAQYTWKKATRLYPVYWIAVVVTFLVTALFLPTRAVSWGSAIVNLTMLQSFLGVDLVDGAYWTLANELVFYAFIALFVVILKQKKNLPAFLLIWICTLLGYHMVPLDTTVYRLIGKILISGYGHMFIAGSALWYAVYNKPSRWLSVTTIGLCFIYQLLVHDLNYFFFFLVSFFLIILGIWMHEKQIAIPEVVAWFLSPVRYVAMISYPLYLIHQNIGYAIMAQLESVGLVSEWIVVVPIVVTVLFAALLHRYVEIPFPKRAILKEKK